MSGYFGFVLWQISLHFFLLCEQAFQLDENEAEAGLGNGFHVFEATGKVEEEAYHAKVVLAGGGFVLRGEDVGVALDDGFAAVLIVGEDGLLLHRGHALHKAGDVFHCPGLEY